MERYKYFARFRRYSIKTKLVKSTDGRRVVNEARSGGKKKGQRKLDNCGKTAARAVNKFQKTKLCVIQCNYMCIYISQHQLLNYAFCFSFYR